MTKEVEKIFCQYCESEYKILYESENTSGLPKFCCFCTEPIFGDDYDENDENKNDE
jgi:hypothetical protein